MSTPSLTAAYAETRREQFEALNDALTLISVADLILEKQVPQTQIARDLASMRKRLAAIVDAQGRRVDL